jgi:hypothetical protein
VLLDPVPLPVPLPVPVPLPEPVPVLLPVPVLSAPDPVLLPVLLPVPVLSAPDPVLVPVLPVLLPLIPELPPEPMAPELSLDLILQVSDSIFTSVTLKVPLEDISLLTEELVEVEVFDLDPVLSQVPFTDTSCPTCAETSCPARATSPFFVIRTYWPPCDSTHPFSFFSPRVELVLFVVVPF